MNFEIGEIPPRWRKGDPLRFMDAPLDGRGAVFLDACRMKISEFEKRGISLNDAAAYTFYYEEVEKVQKWFDWWNS